ncbi:ParB N-terminal domain-containing protein [Antrihabitans cavernicola]|uniref:Uncharacterized protein n=1 Tax=Antrihabitans cavernicola TaxID=2495913 RepID=A0A5A7S8S6_9NOCA|nr:ParB N-terminal domain-containing protein [Spelaeibacter cavernicola]KAA0021884.1 hypothetical protein FOY51_15940 [Spelaeibacter cavernicola]
MTVMGWWRGIRRPEGLVSLADVVSAAGDDGSMGSYDAEVPLAQVLGSVARSDDFDDHFRPRRRTSRYSEVLERFDRGEIPPPIELIRLGELYFVVDGHHRVAAGRELDWTHLPARVHRICSVAFVCSCLTADDLPSKRAERRFLEEVPLPDDVRRQLWLDRPADWSRLADSALAWGFRRDRDGRSSRADVDPHSLASTWWIEEVMPTVTRLRESAPTDLADIQVYITELARRDGVENLSWPSAHWCRSVHGNDPPSTVDAPP